jgi:hypothetical protein
MTAAIEGAPAEWSADARVMREGPAKFDDRHRWMAITGDVQVSVGGVMVAWNSA